MFTILAKGVIRGGQVVVQEPIDLPDGSEVAIAGLPQPEELGEQRRQALQQLIGIWKTDQPPTDDQVEQIIHQERMKKHG